jgi:DNA-binding transcriptional regulator YiaG
MSATRESYHYTECGLGNVYLANGYDIIESPRGRQVIIRDIDGLHTAIGRFLIDEKKDLDGNDIRFLRHEMAMSQARLARLLDVSEQAINRWERGKSNISKPAEALIRFLYAEHLNKGEPGSIEQALRKLADLEDDFDDAVRFHQDNGDEWKKLAA